MRNDLRVHTPNEGMSEYKTFLGTAATGRKTVYENILEMEGLFQVQLQQALADRLPQPFALLGNWRLHCVGTGDGSTCGAILCPTEPGATKLCSDEQEPLQGRYPGKE